MNTELDRIASELAAIREKTTAPDRDFEMNALKREAILARREANDLRTERDDAVAELAKTKADVNWMMGKLMMRDLMFCNSKEFPCAADGYLEAMFVDPKDRERLEWINQNGRAGFHSHNLLIALPHMIPTETATIPEVYNIRHIIDLCIQHVPLKSK